MTGPDGYLARWTVAVAVGFGYAGGGWLVALLGDDARPGAMHFTGIVLIGTAAAVLLYRTGGGTPMAAIDRLRFWTGVGEVVRRWWSVHTLACFAGFGAGALVEAIAQAV